MNDPHCQSIKSPTRGSDGSDLAPDCLRDRLQRLLEIQWNSVVIKDNFIFFFLLFSSSSARLSFDVLKVGPLCWFEYWISASWNPWHRDFVYKLGNEIRGKQIRFSSLLFSTQSFEYLWWTAWVIYRVKSMQIRFWNPWNHSLVLSIFHFLVLGKNFPNVVKLEC